MAYTLIATRTLVAPSGTVTFSSIPGTFKDLVFELSGTCSATNNLSIQFNGDTGTNYSRTYIDGNGTSATSGRNVNANYLPGLITSTNMMTQFATLMSYANTNVNKTVLCRYSSAGDGANSAASLWRSTSAITSVVLATVSGTFSTGYTFKLWGVS